MTPTETAAAPSVFNDWRRGELDDLSMPDPREIGKVIDAAVEMIERLEAAEKERDNANAAAAGIALQAETLQAERDALRDKITEMEKQEPVGTLHDDGCFVWRETAPHQSNYAGWKMALYALPGAQPAPSVPDGWIQRGMAELEAIRNRHDDDTLLNDRTLIERIGKAMLAAAPETKPCP